jgi:hypothetical protein
MASERSEARRSQTPSISARPNITALPDVTALQDITAPLNHSEHQGHCTPKHRDHCTPRGRDGTMCQLESQAKSALIPYKSDPAHQWSYFAPHKAN